MNCIDFDAWTTVVEETDKNAEVMFGQLLVGTTIIVTFIVLFGICK